MAYKPVRLIPDDTKIAFMRVSRFGFFVSGVLCALSILLFAFVGLNVGVDFKGGTVMTIRTAQPANIEQLREQVNGLGYGQAEIQEFGSPNDVLIRLPAVEGGERVVVKVQRLGAEEEIMRDLGLLELFAEKAEHRAEAPLRHDRARGLRARDVYLMIASMAYFYLSNRHTLATFLGALQYVLEEGPRHEWFNDPAVQVAAWLSLVGGVVLLL